LSGALEKATRELREHSEWQLLWDLGPEPGEVAGTPPSR
jgi:hypothetical protein